MDYFGNLEEQIEFSRSVRFGDLKFWPALDLELALAEAKNDPGKIDFVLDVLEKWHSKPCNARPTHLLPPFYPDLLRSIEIDCQTKFKKQTETAKYTKELAFDLRKRFVISRKRESKNREHPGAKRKKVKRFRSLNLASYIVHTANQLTQPFEVGRFSRLQEIANRFFVETKKTKSSRVYFLDQFEKLGLTDKQMSEQLGEVREIWNQRLIWPSHSLQGLDISSFTNNAKNEIDTFWKRFDRILDCNPKLFSLKLPLVDLIRRLLCWHFLLVIGPEQHCVPVPVFPMLVKRTKQTRVFFLGCDDLNEDETRYLEVSSDFRNETERALRTAVDIWITNNKTWSPNVHLVEEHHNCTLVLDFRWVYESLRRHWNDSKPLFPAVLEDRSAGLAIATGVANLMAGGLPNSTLWATGVLGRVDEASISYSPRQGRKVTMPIAFNADVIWPEREKNRGALIKGLVEKFKAAKAHGIAQTVVFPEDYSEEVTERFQQQVRDYQTEISSNPVDSESSLSIRTASVSKVLTAINVSQPLSILKFKYINAPDLGYSFADLTAWPGLEDYSRKCYEWLSAVKSNAALTVVGAQLSGKSFAISSALWYAKSLLHQRFLTAPKVTHIRMPAFSHWCDDAWLMIFLHCSIPIEETKEFFNTSSNDDKATIFAYLLRQFGPDVLVLSSLENTLPPPNSLERHFPNQVLQILNGTGKLLNEQKQNKRRPKRVKDVLGSIQLILELSDDPHLPGDTFNSCNDILCSSLEEWGLGFDWSPAMAWEAVDMFLRDKCEREDLCYAQIVLFLKGLSLFEQGCASNSLYEIVSWTIDDRRSFYDAAKRFLERLSGLYLIYNWGTFSVVKAQTMSDDSVVNSGLLIREGQGAFHIHPLLRQHLAGVLLQELPSHSERFRLRFAKLCLDLVTRGLCPFLGSAPSMALADRSSFLPETKSQAHLLLTIGRNSLKGLRVKTGFAKESRKNKIPLERRKIDTAELELLRYYHRPSVFQIYNMHEGRLVTGEQFSFNHLGLHRSLKSIRASHSKPLPAIELVRALIAQKLDPSELIEANEVKEDLVVDGFNSAIVAVRGRGDHDPSDVWLSLRIESEFIAFLLRYRKGKHEQYLKLQEKIPTNYRENSIFASWQDLLSRSKKLSDMKVRDRYPIRLNAFHDVGDTCRREGNLELAEKTYLSGVKNSINFGFVPNSLLLRLIALKCSVLNRQQVMAFLSDNSLGVWEQDILPDLLEMENSGKLRSSDKGLFREACAVLGG